MTLSPFSVRRDWPAVCNDAPLPKIEAVTDLILGEFQKAISVAFHTFHQRRADMRDIKTAHEGTANVLAEVQKRVTDAYKEVEKLYRSIPVYGTTQEKVHALAGMLYLDTVKEICVDRSRELQKLLRCPKHQADLKSCKEKVAELDALSDWGNALDYLPIGLSQAQKQEKLQAVVLEKDNYLYEWFSTYKSYVAQQLKAPVENKDLQYEVKESASPLQSKDLLPEEQFRTGQFLSTYRYSAVHDVTAELGTIEGAIKKLQDEGFTQMRSACRGDVRVTFPEMPIDAINRCFNSLIAKTFSTHIHAGWYYENAVRIHANEVSTSFATFQTKLTDTFGLKCVTVGALSRYATAVGSLEKLSYFYEALKVAGVDLIIKQTVVREGKSLLQPSPDESAIPTCILSRRKSLKDLGDTALSYLMKGFIRNIHFQKDYEFEAVIAMLKDDPAYRTDFEACLKANAHLTELYNAYSLKTPLEIMPILHEVYEPLPEDMPSEAQVMRLFHLEQALLLLMQNGGRISWLEGKIKQLRVDLGAKVEVGSDISTESSKLLYERLYKCLFGTNSLTREYANGDILAQIHDPAFTLDSVTGLVRVMLLRWRLEQFMQTGHLDIEPPSVHSVGRGLKNLLAKEKVLSRGELILAALFKEYTSDNAALWRCQYGFGYMELALRLYLKQSKEKGIRSELWDKFLNYYHDFRNALEIHGELKRGTESFERASMLYAKAQALYLASPGDPIIDALLLEMKQFVNATRFTYAKEPPTA